jgi:hypothetical protein
MARDSVRRYSYRELVRVADSFLDEHHPDRSLPVPIEEIIELRFGLDIVPVPGLLTDLDVDAFLTSDLKEIHVDRHIQENVRTRYRASLAHELSHVLIHEPFFASRKFSNFAEWKATLAEVPEKELNLLEAQAALLGALILVPVAQLRQEVEKTVKKLPATFKLESIPLPAKETFARGLAPTFAVSPHLLFRRLSQDRYW